MYTILFTTFAAVSVAPTVEIATAIRESHDYPGACEAYCSANGVESSGQVTPCRHDALGLGRLALGTLALQAQEQDR